ncbi:SAM-dependent methyltransferase [Rhodoferax saidenbachensis]|uniref:SAM-dependent methyltransferase n=1 Tax=Rhodoferax saidenbachensis TaxID=1484693 RepID=A0A1P8K6W6_9BURK|nr:SAM-dependent methyltransferase [Rhodoferax saidenbachensis]
MAQHIRAQIAAQGGWIGFDAFMALALYAPGLGYYAHGSTKFGVLPQGLRGADGQVTGAGSDFVTAPEMTPLFGQAVARQVAQALQATQTDAVWEFGAGSGALALQVLQALGDQVASYTIVDLSDSLKARQQETLQAFVDKVRWVTELPAQMRGVVLGNEVLDAMPVQLLARVGGVWHERGVACSETEGFEWKDRPTALRPPLDIPGDHDYLTEIHPQGEAFVRTLADHLETGAIFLLDYGFPESEYYHPQRHMGTVMCHRAHQSDAEPLDAVGLKDITAHVNFTGIAVAAQDAGLELLGYTNQAHFLMNCGLVDAMQTQALPERVAAQKLLMEHEMGELFKVIGLTKGVPWDALGFVHGDKTHRL